MWYFDEETLLLAHYKLVERFGGSHGVRDINRIRSVLNAPKQNIFGKEQYASIYDKAAVYIRNIIGDHPFVDGNKRTGMTAGLFFLEKNGTNIRLSEKELEDFAVKVATESLQVKDIAEWLKEHSEKI
jgi:death-on-curing protein